LVEFKLQFDPLRIRELSERYSYSAGDAPFEAGRQIAAGELKQIGRPLRRSYVCMG